MPKIPNKDIKDFLDHYVDKYNCSDFIINDPISVPHRFTVKQDVEIIAFWTATLAWGNRNSIIKSAETLCDLMDQSPFQFITNHQESDRIRFENFVHRTFQYTDSLYFLDFLQFWYKHHHSLETAFVLDENGHPIDQMELLLSNFKKNFFSRPFVPNRTMKHVSDPATGSRCKRLLMFLRWMVRKDDKGVDFGIWSQITPSILLLPLDLHVERTARKLGLLTRKSLDWKAVVELGNNCSKLDPIDPSKYDFALFGLSLEKNSLIF
ncbi:MAG: TIGR02757 family protein [Saprospiraceae bacterium]|nr:TIGR02757 family protein [Saprospiraceae bacterium]MBK9629791.1 TIGR02757 family protein [Saprospiraceae bacterium]